MRNTKINEQFGVVAGALNWSVINLNVLVSLTTF